MAAYSLMARPAVEKRSQCSAEMALQDCNSMTLMESYLKQPAKFSGELPELNLIRSEFLA